MEDKQVVRHKLAEKIALQCSYKTLNIVKDLLFEPEEWDTSETAYYTLSKTIKHFFYMTCMVYTPDDTLFLIQLFSQSVSY